MKERKWIFGNDNVEELYECKSLEVVKNYVSSFSSNVEENVNNTRKKAGMLFSANFDHRKVNPQVYIKFLGQACLPSLLYGTELFPLTPTLLEKFERCQQWFLKHVFYAPVFTLKEIAPQKLLF